MKGNKKYLFLIILGLILAFLPIRKVFFGGFLNPIDLNFYFNIEKIFKDSFFVWDGMNNGIFNVVHLILKLPLSSFSIFFYKLGSPIWLINKIWFILPIFILFLATFYLSKTIIELRLPTLKNRSFLLSTTIAFIFIVSKDIVFSLSFGWPIKYCLTLAGSFLMIANFLKYIELENRKNLIFSVIFSIFSVSLLQHFIFSNIIIFLIILENLLIKKVKFSLIVKKYFLFLSGVFLINFWWIIIYFYSIKSGFSYYSIDIIQQIKNSTFNNLPRTLLFENSIPPAPFNSHFLKSKLEMITLLLFWIFFIGLFLIRRNKKRLVLFLSILVVILLFFATGKSRPTGFIFIEIAEKIKIFSMFRTISKVNGFLFFTFIFGSSLFLYKFSNIVIFSKKKRMFTIFLVLSALIFTLISPGYFSGNLRGSLKSFNLPDSYKKTNEMLDKKELDGNLLILPFPEWFSNFTWNNDLNHIHNPLVNLVNKPAIYDEFSNSNLNMTQLSFIKNLLDDDNEEASKIKKLDFIRLLNIQNVIIQKDNLVPLHGKTSIEDSNLSLKQVATFLEKNTRKDSESNELIIFKINNNNFLPHFYTPQKLFFSKRNIEELPRIVSRDDWQTRSAVFFGEQNANKDSELSSLKDKNYQESDLPVLEFKKINPTKYRIRVHGATQEFPLVFSESFHQGWKAYLTQVESRKSKVESDLSSYKILDGNDDDPKSHAGNGASQASILDNYKILDGNEDDQADINELKEYIQKGWVSDLGDDQEKEIKHKTWENNREKLDYIEKYNIDFISKNFQDTIQNDNLPSGHIWETWLQKPIDNNQNHLMVNGYANSWVINPTELCQQVESSKLSSYKEGSCIKNPDGSYDFEVVVEFWPQRLFYIGLGISGTTLILCLAYLIYDYRKNRKPEVASPKE